MFEVGDLVRFREEGVVTIMRNKPTKAIGLITKIDRDAYHCYSGDMDDRVYLIWLGTDIEEVLPEFYLEKLNKDA